MARDYFEHFKTRHSLNPNSTGPQRSENWTQRATNKAQTYYRKLVSALNKYIDTVQIKQCGQVWKTIDFEKVTATTLMKQRKTFLKYNNDPRFIAIMDPCIDLCIDPCIDPCMYVNMDRELCRDKLICYLNKVKSGEAKLDGSHISIVDFIKNAIGLHQSYEVERYLDTRLRCNLDNERLFINEAWKSSGAPVPSLENMIAMVDTSNSMETDNNNPLYAAIGIGIQIAEKSTLGKRVLTFNNSPSWINLDKCNDFVDEVQMVHRSTCTTSADFHKAIKMILDQVIVNKLPAEEVESLVLVVLSAMEFDLNSIGPLETIRQNLDREFHEAGMSVCGTGYKVPHIVFWNTRSTNGFPELSYQDNVSMISGYSPGLLSELTERDNNNGYGCIGIKEATPWKLLTRMLNKERYNVMENLVNV